MDAESTLLVLGAGGHGRVVADAALRSGWTRVFATDRDPARCRGELLPGVALLELEAALSTGLAVSHRVHVAIGDAGGRRAESEAMGAARWASVVHPDATVSPHAVFDGGCFVAAQAVVGPGARLGAGVIVNHGAVVDHDNHIGNWCHIAPRATLGGGVTVGDGVLVGAGATVLPGLAICAGATIGAGAVVTAPVTQPGVYSGVPARRIR